MPSTKQYWIEWKEKYPEKYIERCRKISKNTKIAMNTPEIRKKHLEGLHNLEVLKKLRKPRTEVSKNNIANANIKLRQNKTYEEIYGIDKAKKMKEQMSISLINHKVSNEQIEKCKKTWKNKVKSGWISSCKGKLAKELYGDKAQEYSKKRSESRKLGIQEGRIKNWIFNIPNKSENNLNDILQQILPNEYLLNVKGEVIIGGKCLDYININGQKKGIELFGDYWHGEIKTKRSKEQEELKRINHFKKYGWNILIIWEHELKNKENLINKIVVFNNKQYER